MSKENKASLTDVLFTAHGFANQLALTKLYDLQEHLNENEPTLAAFTKSIIDECIFQQERFHGIYQLMIKQYKSKEFYDKMDEFYKTFDKTLMK